MDPSASQDIGGHPDVAPRLVLDPLALAVLGSNVDKGFFESFDVNLICDFITCDPAVQIATLLDEMRPLEGIGNGNFRVDLISPRNQRFGAHLSAAARSVLLEGHKVTAYGIPLATALREGILVGISESALALGLSFPWRHITSVAAIAKKCNSAAKLDRRAYTVTRSWNLHIRDLRLR